ncbi:hypothetical protein SmJEL517_g04994 [Synchytrium microbalum]|uniref:sphinganine-1-phosphate aldolase n=1 Tax=Synchytrium microbalum TaxID=1806994 RepID=A0A507BXY6_9FUNG|nr:uncharacterized protein SmJEL517_g04994 [Synchytrium microbalum]TPX31719.1 hypothetical protein SmJEL517_g04994 [Synchytrium microbalum]
MTDHHHDPIDRILHILQSKHVETIKNVLLAYAVYYYSTSVIGLMFKVVFFRGDIRKAFRSLLQSLILGVRRYVPGIDAQVQKEVAKSVAGMEKGIIIGARDKKYTKLPAKGLDTASLRMEMQKYQKLSHVDFKDGKVSGAVYHGGAELNALLTEAYHMNILSNPLHPEMFPGVRKMESEVIQMVLSMYNAPEDAGGNITSGGTESILMAVKAARDFMEAKKGITTPNMVVPETVHPAFDKAAQYFKIQMIKIPVDPVTFKVNLKKVRAAINRNTVLLVGSCPNYPHGIVDDIPALSKLALRYRIPLHVDACLGGFIVPFVDKAGFPYPDVFDFRNEGVTSISCDTHKYGFAPKGSSVVMFRTKELRNYEYFITTEWQGGVYASPTMAGSRPGALVAACWAAMVHFGESGYVDSTRKIVGKVRKLKAAIHGIPELELIGDPMMSVIAFRGKDDFPIFGIIDLLSRKNWHLTPLQQPSGIHLSTTYVTDEDQLIADIKEAVAIVKKDPKSAMGESAAIYGTVASIPDRTIIRDVAKGFLDLLTKI